MEKNKSLIPFQQSNQLAKVANSLEITNKILAKADEQLIPYRKKDKWGFCTRDKKIVIDCIYDKVKWFKEGVSAVQINGKWGFVDNYGFTIIPFDYEEALSFENNFAVVKFNGHAYKINKNREFQLIELEQGHEWYFVADDYYKAKITSDGSQTIENYRLKISLSDDLFIRFDKDNWLHDRDIKLKDEFDFNRKEVNGMIPFLFNGKFGYKSIDKSIVIPAIYDDGYDFKNGFALVQYEEKWGYLDKSGNQFWED